MKKCVLLFFFGILIVLLDICKGNVFAIKCCASDEQLDTNLTLCQKLNISHSIENTYLYNTTVDTMFNNESTNAFAVKDDAYSDNLTWLPEQLRIALGEDDVVLFGRQNNCSNSRTVRLQIPRDENRLNWLPNGSLILSSYTALGKIEKHLFDPQEFCADTFTHKNGTQHHAILLCPCQRMHCLKKCCPLGQAVVCDSFNCDCHQHDSEWMPFYKDLPVETQDFSFEIVADQNLTCGKGFQDLVYVFDSYPLYLLHRFWEEMLKDGQVCGDTVVGLSETPGQGMTKCSPEIPFPKAYVLVNWLHVPEAVLLAVALLVTVSAPRRRVSAFSSVHDLALAWHAAALFVRCLLWSVYLKAKWSCSLIPIFIYFFSMAASFWLNVLCVNMACGFWKPLGVQHSRWGRSREMFLLYSLYAWGASAALTTFTAVMWYSKDVPPGLLRPTLHETRTCFREEEGDGKLATFAYYYGPIAGLLFVNALLFSSTALRVMQLQRNRTILKKMSEGKDAFRNNRSVMIYIKLLWLMGVTEMAVEAVAWISNSNEYYFALAASCLDVVRAGAIFFLSCCKRRTLVAMRDRLCACALRYAPRWCCPGRRNEETDLRAVAGRNGKTSSDASVTTEVTDSDGDVCECGT